MKTSPSDRSLSYCFVFCLLLLSLCACKKDDRKPDYPADTNEYLNSWVLDSMKVFYYWNTSIPKKPQLSMEPEAFFNDLKNSADRFSLLVNPSKPLTSNPTLSAALGIDMIGVEVSGQPQCLVTLVVPGAEADQAGIRRGDQVLSINGTAIMGQNINTLINGAIAQENIRMTFKNKAGEVSYRSSYPADKPVHVAKTFERDGTTVAYLFFNAFRENALSGLKAAFSDFRAAHATELVLDMRYNPGGQVNIAALLTALIAPVKGSDIFAEYRGNSRIGNQRNSFDETLSAIGTSVAQLSSYRLPLSRVYILTGSHTASSAELVANSLSPYLSTVRVGRQTLGKDMASFEVKDMRNPRLVKWVIHPLVYKLFNANGIGNYTAGLRPDIGVDELELLPLKPFGDPEDPLLSRALFDITGVSAKSSLRSVPGAASAKVFYDSRNAIDEKAGIVVIHR